MLSSVLTLDKNWNIHQWIAVKQAIVLESLNLVADHLGTEIVVYRGGMNRISGQISELVTSSIIVVKGAPNSNHYKKPALTNSGLFQRDRFVCAYCGSKFSSSSLTRDHIIPTSRGGEDTWMNTVTACRACNSMKSDMMPGEKVPYGQVGPQGDYKMSPLYVPYVPCKSEAMIMKNRSIMSDQMEFLLARVKNKKSRIFDYAKELALN